jgi:5-methylcytosine-specific restriction endonuclease McrA
MAKRRPYHVQPKHRPKKTGRAKFTKEQRIFIYERDGYTCQLCACDLSSDEHKGNRILDHRLPLAQFGTNSLSNIWLLCNDCDKAKAATIIPQIVNERLTHLLNEWEKRKKPCRNVKGAIRSTKPKK